MKKLIKCVTILCVTTLLLNTSCIKKSKSCKANHKKIKKMRKSGQLNM